MVVLWSWHWIWEIKMWATTVWTQMSILRRSWLLLWWTFEWVQASCSQTALVLQMSCWQQWLCSCRPNQSENDKHSTSWRTMNSEEKFGQIFLQIFLAGWQIVLANIFILAFFDGDVANLKQSVHLSPFLDTIAFILGHFLVTATGIYANSCLASCL